ncbi:MAG: hypothetical protein AAGD04_07755 [Pseudomonadota bacterium]
MFKTRVVTLIILTSLGTISGAQTATYPDCYCTDSKGNRVEIGDAACLVIGTRAVLALCDMSLNNPIWRYQEDPCPIS